jgi:hypothetical protein
MRKHLTYANMVATLALVFAMSGGAYAASKYLITSTTQISPKVVKALKGKRGPAGPAGSAGVAGPAGPAGPAGTKGDTGLQGEKGVQGERGLQGEQGLPGKDGFNGTNGVSVTTKEFAGKQGPCEEGGSEFTAAANSKTYACNGKAAAFSGGLPEGATETGSWVISMPLGSAPEWRPISFALPLAAELSSTQVHVAPDPECPGTAQEPKANSGNLCVYIGYDPASNAGITGVFKPSANIPTPGASTSGGLLLFKNENTQGSAFAYGTWAVTG